MKILWYTNVFMTLWLVTRISNVTGKLLDISKDPNVGVAHVTKNIIQPNTTMNDAIDRKNDNDDDDDDDDDTTDLNWDTNRAIKDIAYYLRAHKFVDYDRRYYNNVNDVKHRLWEEFPKPPLRSLHWEVRKYCSIDFIKCLKYLNSIVQQTSLKREDDTIVIIRNNNWTSKNNMLQIINADRECKAAKKRDNLTYVPFQGPIERFQWRTTASYYMCWFTMLGRPELYSFNEPCDDFADCLTRYRNNRDLRAHDGRPFGCALYSFCPDPCCTMRVIWSINDCYRSPTNPCYKPNTTVVQKCSLNRLENQNFLDLISNKINVTCECDEKGYEWSTRFGLCVDINECTRGLHNCLIAAGEFCINLPGDFECICQNGFVYSEEMDSCVENLILKQILMQTIADYVNTIKSSNLLDNIVKFLTKSFAIKCNYFISMILFFSLFNFIIK